MKNLLTETNIEISQIKQIAYEIGTPLFIYDAEVIRQSYEGLKEVLSSQAEIFYSIKANPNMAICAELKACGAGAEICSSAEFQVVLKAGFDPGQIIFVGPAKSDEDIEQALSLSIYAIVCESFSEFERISAIAHRLQVIARVALRLNPEFYAKSAMLKMGGKPSQFGIDENLIFQNIDHFKNIPNIKIIVIHVYNSTRILDAETVYNNTKNVFSLSKRFAAAFSIKPEMVDIGGGVGVPYYSNENFFDLKRLKKLLRPDINLFRKEYPDTRIIMESGRFLTAMSGIFLTRAFDV